MGFTLEIWKETAGHIAKKIDEKTEELCQLDSMVGDGDHGTTIRRGTKAGLEKVMADIESSLQKSFLNFSMGMMSSMGGASGPIFASLFQGMAIGCQNKTEIDAETMLAMLKTGFDKIQAIGKAELNDKTLLDSLGPAIDSYKAALESGKSIEDCLLAAASGAWAGVEATKQMISKRGRSRYAGERGLGHADAGATSMAYMLDAFATTMKEHTCAN